MLTQVQIGQAGERFVARELAAKGYWTNVDTKAPGSTDVEALGTNVSLRVQVKTAVSPNSPAALSTEEERNIKALAARNGSEAWEARVQVDPKLNLVGAIGWRKLS